MKCMLNRINMNEIVNNFLLTGDKFMLVDHLLKTKKEFKNLKKQEIQAMFTKMNLIRLVFKHAWVL